MQGDAVAIAAVDMGAYRAVTMRPQLLGEFFDQPHHPREGHTRRHVSGYQREVPLCPPLSLHRADLVLPRFMTVDRPFIPSTSNSSVFAPAFATAFIKCLESLPNLHTLEIGSEEDIWSLSSRYLRRALMFVKLPQIKTLILPPAAHHLLKPCTNVEDVDWVIGSRPAVIPDGFLRSLASIRDSKIKRMAIPLILPGSPSRK